MPLSGANFNTDLETPPFRVIDMPYPVRPDPESQECLAQVWRPHTLMRAVHAEGSGIHTGCSVAISLEPGSVGSGITFVREDTQDRIVLGPGCVHSTDHATTLGRDGKPVISMVEHCLSALSIFGIQDCLIRVNGPEMPIFDGSAKGYLDMIMRAGFARIDRARIYRVTRKAIFSHKNSTFMFSPADRPRLELDIDYPHPGIGAQHYASDLAPEVFRNEIAFARTFGFISDREQYKARSLAAGAQFDNVLLFDGKGIMNREGFRCPQECARHKWIDVVGDIYSTGRQIFGCVQAFGPGHTANRYALDAALSDTGLLVSEDMVFSSS